MFKRQLMKSLKRIDGVRICNSSMGGQSLMEWSFIDIERPETSDLVEWGELVEDVVCEFENMCQKPIYVSGLLTTWYNDDDEAFMRIFYSYTKRDLNFYRRMYFIK